MGSISNQQFLNDIPMEMTTPMKNKNGQLILVYLNWEFKQETGEKPSQVLFKVRTNRFLEVEEGVWERVIDFKEKLSTEFYISIDYPKNADEFLKEKGSSLSIEDLNQKFGINLYYVWQRFIDKPCSWKTEKPTPTNDEDIPPDYIE
ncbi:MAG: hypothetical protein VXW15_09580 [Bdellovibrionota bacterium]|nr:hypothetical protein [Bdellovibrionota bacterium]